MVAIPNQRWFNKRDTYRRPEETIRTSEYEVSSIPDDKTAKRFVLQHHYSTSYPAARFRFGLHHHDKLMGVAVFSVPCNPKTLKLFPGGPNDSVELGRFVLLDRVPGNGETWFLARCFELLRREEQVGVVSFSDPIPRDTADGREVFPGHIGTIYQAFNGRYLGRSNSSVLKLLPDGTVIHNRTLSKIRARDQGWEYATEQLVKFGANKPPQRGDIVPWLNYWLARLTRPKKHPGNHKYGWVLDKRHADVFKDLKDEPYPKWLPQRRWWDVEEDDVSIATIVKRLRLS